MAKVVVVFEVADNAAPFVRGSKGASVEEHLHEALCQGIHEGNYRAIDWLTSHVADVKLDGLPGDGWDQLTEEQQVKLLEWYGEVMSLRESVQDLLAAMPAFVLEQLLQGIDEVNEEMEGEGE